MTHQVDGLIGEPLADERDDGPALAIATGLVDAVGLLQAAEILRLKG